MLEIMFLVYFCKKLAAIARDKNRAGGWGALGAIGWITGEISGAIIGAKAGGVASMALYGYALLGAALGAVVAYVIVIRLVPIPLDTDLPQARVL